MILYSFFEFPSLLPVMERKLSSKIGGSLIFSLSAILLVDIFGTLFIQYGNTEFKKIVSWFSKTKINDDINQILDIFLDNYHNYGGDSNKYQKINEKYVTSIIYPNEYYKDIRGDSPFILSNVDVKMIDLKILKQHILTEISFTEEGNKNVSFSFKSFKPKNKENITSYLFEISHLLHKYLVENKISSYKKELDLNKKEISTEEFKSVHENVLKTIYGEEPKSSLINILYQTERNLPFKNNDFLFYQYRYLTDNYLKIYESPPDINLIY